MTRQMATGVRSRSLGRRLSEKSEMNANAPQPDIPRGWTTRQAYAMAALCLAVGLVLGYLFRGSASHSTPASSMTQPAAASAPATHPQMPSLEDMKRMADKKAEPLLTKLKTDPNNS